MSIEKYLEAMDKVKNFSDVVYERTLTDKEKDKREEIAKAIERENPDMDMSKKMAIATAQAKKVSESIEQIDEAGTQHPLPGHDYHRKTDAELRFIQKDAKEAEDAMSGHNPKAANKYADQKNDASTVLHFRKKGMPDWYKKKYGHIKEETDTSALDAMDAKEKRKENIRKFVKNQSAVKIKRTPGKPEVKEETELGEGRLRLNIINVTPENKKHFIDQIKKDEDRRKNINKTVKSATDTLASIYGSGSIYTKEETELDEALRGGEKAAYDVGFAHGRKNSPKIDANKSFGSYDKHYHDGYHAGKSSAETEDWHEEQKSKRLRKEEVESIDEALPPHLAKHFDEKGNLKDPEKQKSFEKMMKKKIKDAVVKDVTPAGYGPKNEELETIAELSDKTLDSYQEKSKKEIDDKIKSGDFKGVTKRNKGMISSIVAKHRNASNQLKKDLTKEELELDENKYSSGGEGPSYTNVGTKVKIRTSHKNAGKTGTVKKIDYNPVSGKKYHVEHEDGTHETYGREHIRRTE